MSDIKHKAYRSTTLEEGVYVPERGIDYPDDPFQRLVKVENDYHCDDPLVFDETYPYIDESWDFKKNRLMNTLGLFFMVRPLNRIRFGLKIKGRKNLRKAKPLLEKGAVTICNHVYRWDGVSVIQALRPQRPMIPMYAEHFNGPDRWFLRYFGGIPVPQNVAGMRKFNEAFDEFHRRGLWIHVFPEEVRWDCYKAIRPFRKGAFTMAYKYDIPLIPLVISYRERSGIYKLFGQKDMPLMTISIGEPILPDRSSSRKAEVDRLRVESHAQMVKMAGILNNPWPAIPEDEV